MHVLLATDGSANGNACADLFASLTPDPDTVVTVITVVPTLPLPGSELEAPPGHERGDIAQIAAAIADRARDRLQAAGYQATAVVRRGNPVEEILAVAAEREAGLVVLGIRGVGRLRRFIVGSVASAVARRAAAPVLLVHDPASLSIALIAGDGSAGAAGAIAALTRLPTGTLERIILLNVMASSDAGSSGSVLDAAERALEPTGVPVSRQTATGNEVEEIVRVAEEEQVSVIALGASNVLVDGEPLLGTTAHGVINRAPCSILIGR